MKALLPYFEREIHFIRNDLHRFAEQYPSIAAELRLIGDRSGDPHIERLIQANALLNARTAKRLDDSYTHFTSALLDLVQPHFLRVFPATSIVQIDAAGAEGVLSDTVIVPRGTELLSKGRDTVACRFRTCSEVVLAPVKLRNAHFSTAIHAPPGSRLPIDATAEICIELETTAAGGFSALNSTAVRLFMDGEPTLTAVLRDTLFMGACHAFMQADGADRWVEIGDSPVLPAGCEDKDAIVPFGKSEQSAYRLLSEFFVFPEKFNFLELDLQRLIGKCTPRRTLTLHLLIADLHADSPQARTLRALSSKNLLLGCTPAVNLFFQPAIPIKLTGTRSEYPLYAERMPPEACDIFSVDKVILTKKAERNCSTVELHAVYSHGRDDTPGQEGRYWLLNRDDEKAASQPGHEYTLAFVDRGFNPHHGASGSASIELTCSNRDLPGRLPYGAASGDLITEGLAGTFPIRMLRRPTTPVRRASASGAQWGLVSHLALNHRSLVSAGVEGFRSLLRLYAPHDSHAAQRQIAGVADLTHKRTSARIVDHRGSSFVQGVEVHVTLEEDAFLGTGIHAFAQVLDHFFGLFVHLNSFSQLVIVSKLTGKEILRCPPRNGALPLL